MVMENMKDLKEKTSLLRKLQEDESPHNSNLIRALQK